MNVTERMLVDMCRRINNGQLKHWDSGLKVERRGGEYVVMRLFSKPQQGRSKIGGSQLIKKLRGRNLG